MTVPPLLSRLAGLVRRRPAPPPDVLDPYAAAVLHLADRAEALYHAWFEHTALVSDSEKLANAAAIHRWEAATLARKLEQIAPPAELAHDHGRLLGAVELARRAAQLLSSGSRYHNANAVCEGQMLLTESRARRLKALALLRRFLAERLPSADAVPSDGDSPVAQPPLAASGGAASAAPPDAAHALPDTPPEPAGAAVPADVETAPVSRGS